MIRFRLLLLLGVVLFVENDRVRAATPDKDAAALAAKIDHYLTVSWDADKIQPAAPATDAEFVRRVYLDLAGRIPSVSEARGFFDDKRPDKRRRLIDQLLEGPRYVTHFTNVWRALLLPESGNNLQAGFLAPGFESWLRASSSRTRPTTPWCANC